MEAIPRAREEYMEPQRRRLPELGKRQVERLEGPEEPGRLQQGMGTDHLVNTAPSPPSAPASKSAEIKDLTAHKHDDQPQAKKTRKTPPTENEPTNTPEAKRPRTTDKHVILLSFCDGIRSAPHDP